MGRALTGTQTPRTLYLPGRGDTVGPEELLPPPGDVVEAISWPTTFLRIPLDDDFLARTFADQVEFLSARVSPTDLVLAHSFSAWIALAYAVGLAESGDPLPELLLISPVLFQGGTGRLGYRPPRSAKIRKWMLGHDSAPEPAVDHLRARLHIISGADDPQCPASQVRLLGDAGFRVDLIEGGGHRLTENCARAKLKDLLGMHAANRGHKNADGASERDRTMLP